MKYNEKGAMAFQWIYGIIFLFLLALFYIVLNHAITDHFLVTYENMIPDSSPAKADVISDMTEWMSYWNILPFVFMVIIFTYWLASALRKEQNGFPPS